MELQQKIVEQLERFVADGPKAVDAALISGKNKGYIIGLSPTAGASVSITFPDFDKFSIALHHLEVNLPAETEINLVTSADQVGRRLTYLEEPLALIELDEAAGLAILRSHPPREAGEEVIYWEAKIQAQPRPTINLARYRWAPALQERRQLSPAVTFSTTGRIATDLAESLSDQ